MKIKNGFRRAFSLIELSIVLIIIGLLMAAIIKGKDLIRSAEMKKFYNNFVKAWELVYSQYYDRTGMPLGGPLYTKEYGQIKNFVGADYTKNDFVFRDGKTIVKRAKEVGLELPTTTAPTAYAYIISFTKAPKTTMYITFGADVVQKNETINVCLNDDCSNTTKVKTITGQGDGKGNFMIMYNVPYDVAIQLDRIIDGNADGLNGNLICVNNYNTPLNENEFDKAVNVKDLSESYNCFGALHLGSPDKPYVTLIYKLNI